MACGGCFHSPSMLAWSILLVTLCLLNASVVDANRCPRSFNLSTSGQTLNLARCEHLSQLGATLSWTYHAANGSVDVAFRAKPASNAGWVSWGINPSATGMVGTQALIAFRQPNGTMFSGTYNVVSKGARPPLVLGNLSFPVTNLGSEYRHGMISIYATLFLPSNRTMVNQVWEVGSAVDGVNPRAHAFDAANLNSFGSIDFVGRANRNPNPNPSGPSPSPVQTPPSMTPAPAEASSVSRISLTAITLLPALGIFLGILGRPMGF